MSGPPRFRFDTNSPYAHLAAARIEAVLGEVVWEPIAFGFVLADSGRRPWSFDEPSRSEGMAECERRAATYGLPPMTWPPGWPVESYTLAPLRLTSAAGDRRRELALALFRRNFVTGEGLLDDAVLRACWAEAGLEPDRYDEALAAGKATLRTATEAAIAEGVEGVPTVTVGGEHFWGDDRLEAAAAALGR